MGAKIELHSGTLDGILEPGSAVMWLGVGGIGMSALAEFFWLRGVECRGYDRTPSPLTRRLEALNIPMVYDFSAPIPDHVSAVVYTPAVGENCPYLVEARRRNIPTYKRSTVLGRLSNNYRSIAVAGTHGKTTTTALVAHILRFSGCDPVAFVGGIMKNYQTNLLAGNGDRFVVEADEYDKSFLTLTPNLAAVTSLDADHLDVYQTPENLAEHYQMFVAKTRHGGTVVLPAELSNLPVPPSVTPLYVSLSPHPGADVLLENYRIENGRSVFDFRYGKIHLERLRLGLLGKYNAFNAGVAATLSILAGVKPEIVPPALATFEGLYRRFDVVYETESKVLIDDYAHHPTEITSFLSGVKDAYPGRKIVVVFQPHLYTRTRDFCQGFGESLSLADSVILLPIYPAREEPLPGIDSELVAKHVSVPCVVAQSFEEAAELSLNLSDKSWAICTVGAGDIDRLPDLILRRLS